MQGFYPGLGNRSVFHPYSSVGNTFFTFDVVENTDSNPTSNVSFEETLARASLKTHLPGSSVIETKRVGQRTVVYGTDTPTISPFGGGGGCFEEYPGQGNRSVFYPYIAQWVTPSQYIWRSKVLKRKNEINQSFNQLINQS